MKNSYSKVNAVVITPDHEPGDTFQVIDVILETDDGNIDVTKAIDQGKHYHTGKEVAKDLGIDGAVNIIFDEILDESK